MSRVYVGIADTMDYDDSIWVVAADTDLEKVKAIIEARETYEGIWQADTWYGPKNKGRRSQTYEIEVYEDGVRQEA